VFTKESIRKIFFSILLGLFIVITAKAQVKDDLISEPENSACIYHV
jgi:hypothetical protein